MAIMGLGFGDVRGLVDLVVAKLGDVECAIDRLGDLLEAHLEVAREAAKAREAQHAERARRGEELVALQRRLVDDVAVHRAEEVRGVAGVPRSVCAACGELWPCSSGRRFVDRIVEDVSK